MKILITGARGVVGRNLSKLLTETYGFDCWGCGRGSNDNVKHFTVDLRDQSSIIDFFVNERFDGVVHCAANINNDERFDMFRNNLISTLNIVEASLVSGVKYFFNTSSIPVIGEILERPVTEKHPAFPRSVYHLSKLQCEMITEYFCSGSIEFINMRIPSPVGRFMPPRSVFPAFLKKICNHETITLTGNAKNKQNFLDLRDLAAFIYQASFESGKSGLYNVAAKRSYTYRELAEILIKKSKSHSRLIDNTYISNSDFQDWDISTEKAKNAFGYEPKFDLEDTIDWVL